MGGGVRGAALGHALRASLAGAVASTLASRVALLPLGLLQGALLARALEPAGLGRYSALLTDVNLLVTALSLGLPGALSVLIGENTARLRPLLLLALRHGALWIALPGLAGYAAARSLPAGLFGRLPAEVGLIAVLCAVQFLRDVLGSLLLGTQQFHAQNLQSIVIAFFQLGLCVWLYLGRRLDPRSALGIQLAGNLLLGVLQAIALYRLARVHGLWRRDPPAPNVEAARDVAARARRIGARNLLHILPDYLLLRLDVYLVQRLVRQGAQRELGLYQAGVRIAELLLLLPTTLNTVLFAKAATREDLTQASVAGAKLCLFLGLLALGAMALLGQPLLIWFYGPRFAGSFAPCLWVLGGCCTLCFSGPLAGTLAGAGAYPRSLIGAQVCALLVNVGVDSYLIPRHGALGAAMGSAVAYAVSALFLSVAFARRFGVPLSDLFRPESPLALLRRLRGAR